MSEAEPLPAGYVIGGEGYENPAVTHYESLPLVVHTGVEVQKVDISSDSFSRPGISVGIVTGVAQEQGSIISKLRVASDGTKQRVATLTLHVLEANAAFHVNLCQAAKRPVNEMCKLELEGYSQALLCNYARYINCGEMCVIYAQPDERDPRFADMRFMLMTALINHLATPAYPIGVHEMFDGNGSQSTKYYTAHHAGEIPSLV